jgi:hypothetical protein
MKYTKARLWLFAVMVMLQGFSGVAMAGLVDMPDVEVAVVIGGSLQNGQPEESGPQAGVWYLGGFYKTWVDHIATLTDKRYHWLNYAKAGAVSSNGVGQIEMAIRHTTWPDADGVARPHVKTLVLSYWGNTFLWRPFSQTAINVMINDMTAQINTAKMNGVERIVIMGMPRYEDMDLDRFLQIFPIPTHIDQTGYEEVRRQYYAAFSAPNPDYVFVDSWCQYDTLDGLHANYDSSSKAAAKVLAALNSYSSQIGKHSFVTCQ